MVRYTLGDTFPAEGGRPVEQPEIEKIDQPFRDTDRLEEINAGLQQQTKMLTEEAAMLW
jgi:hypothetical protein